MKHIDEYRKRELGEGLVKKIRALSTREHRIMEICGTHTHAISRHGVRRALKGAVKLISGPGCPVCVTSTADVNRAIELVSTRQGVIMATFGDMMRVPGTSSSLEVEKAGGADVRVVYSPLDSLGMAAENPSKEVVLFAVGFETTAPTIAATILRAKVLGLKNFSAFALPKLTPPAMKALLDSGETEPESRIDAFLAPGHVTAVIGADAYKFLALDYRSPCVVAGFEPIDALHGLHMLVSQLEEGRAEIEIQYKRVVTAQGNALARKTTATVFETADAAWRGIGVIPQSGLRINEEFSEFDAEKRFSMPMARETADPHGCACAKVLKGLIAPDACQLFAKACTPATPAGPCMVSSEGTCAAYYKYELVEKAS
jgi:hydrogenase expression/formation protein HypD